MLKILDDESDIREAQQRFEEVFERFIDEKIPAKLGHLGDSFEEEVSWCKDLNIWMCSGIIPGSRYWNAFGIGKPAEGKNVSITCEINFPLRGINRRVAGAFAVASLGGVYVVHRGKIGGGRKGIGKRLFEEKYTGEWIDVKDGEVEKVVALVGELNSPRFARQVSEFVRRVDKIKSPVSSGLPQIEILGDSHEFREEFTGKKHYSVEKQIEALCDHGPVVNGLDLALEGLGLRVGNDRNRDLYVVDSVGRIKVLFEVKTDTSTSSLYSAVGQLMLYSVDLPERPRLILTIPEGVSTAVEGKLNRLGIEVLTYGWSDDEVVFEGLDSLGL